MLKTEDREIEGLAVKTTQLPALRALNLMAKLGRVLAPIVGSVPGLSMQAFDLSRLGPALGLIFAQLNEGEASKLAREILVSTRVTVDGKFIELTSDAAINGVFDGRIPALLLTMGFVLEVNYSGFFPTRKGAADVAPPEGTD